MTEEKQAAVHRRKLAFYPLLVKRRSSWTPHVAMSVGFVRVRNVPNPGLVCGLKQRHESRFRNKFDGYRTQLHSTDLSTSTPPAAGRTAAETSVLSLRLLPARPVTSSRRTNRDPAKDVL